MTSYMLDSDICIYVMKGRGAALVDRFNTLVGQICISSVCLAELCYGIEKSERRAENLRRLDELTARLEVEDFDAEAAAHYGEIRSTLERLGTPCGALDMMIGAHARSLGMTLVTNNRREFDRMPGLLVENWV